MDRARSSGPALGERQRGQAGVGVTVAIVESAQQGGGGTEVSSLALDGDGRTIGGVISRDSEGSELGGDLADLREQNLRRILAALLGSRRGLSQPRLAELTGLSRSTVSSLLSHHLEGVLQTQLRRNGENSGRPIKAWSIVRDSCYSIGVDIGQYHVSAVLLDLFGNNLGGPHRVAVDNSLKDPHGILGTAAVLVKDLVQEGEVDCERIAAITVGLPGPVDLARGGMADDATRPWAGIDVRDEIRKRWAVGPVPRRLADNNANLGALAEHRFGAGLGAQSLIFLDWSAGVGAGIVLEGRIWRGQSGVAGEIGHVAVKISAGEASVLKLPKRKGEWEACERCGQVDCLERLAGGLTVSAAAELPNLGDVVEAALAERTTPRAERAQAVLKVAARLIGRAIGPTVTVLNLDRVIIGGVVGQPALYPLLVEDLSRGAKETVFSRAWADVSLDTGALGPEAPVLGAAILGLDMNAIDFLIARAQATQQTPM